MVRGEILIIWFLESEIGLAANLADQIVGKNDLWWSNSVHGYPNSPYLKYRKVFFPYPNLRLPHFVILAFCHPRFIIRILSSAFCHPHFVILILSSALYHPHPPSPSAIRHQPSGPQFTETRHEEVLRAIETSHVIRLIISRREVFNFPISRSIRRKESTWNGKMLQCLRSYLKWNLFWRARQDEFYASELHVCYVNKDKWRVMSENRFFWRFLDGEFWIFISLVP